MDTEKLMQYVSGDLPEGERRAVYEWIMADKQNAAEYRSVRRLYDISLWVEPQTKTLRRRKFRTLAALGAAAAALAVVAGVMFSLGRSSAPEPALFLRSVTAPMGKEVKMNLADGTLVWLNSGSTLSVDSDSGDGKRSVTLRGEGYFKVAHDPSHPFIVHTAGPSVEVLGTEFNVKSFPEKGEWSAALMSGSIALLDSDSREMLRVSPGTLISIEDGRMVSSVMNPDNYLWKDGIMFFDDESMGDIFSRLAAYYDISFDTSACHTLSKHYTGKFRTVDGYDHILKVLRLDSSFSYRIRHESGRTTIIVKD